LSIKLSKFASKIELGTVPTFFVTWAVFLATLVVALITLTSVIFPALVIRSFGEFENSIGINPFETGIWAFPFLAVNSFVLVVVLMYKRKLLPSKIKKSINFIFRFEVSQKVAFFVIIILLGFYITFSVEELFNGKYHSDYYQRVQPWINNYTITEIGDWGIGYHVTLFFLKASDQIFDNDKVYPFIASIALLILTYTITAEITKKRFAGIVAMIIVLQSGVFLMYDTSVAYPNFWILFYLSSLYLILKTNLLSPISYVASILSKILTGLFLPMTLFFIYRTNTTRKKKIKMLLYYGIALTIFLGVVFATGTSIGITELGEQVDPVVGGEVTDLHEFWSGFTAISSSLRLDGLVLLFLLPCIVGLFFASRNKVLHADSIMFMIMTMLISAPFLAGFTDSINVAYRFVPLVVFFAIGVGILLSKRAKVLL